MTRRIAPLLLLLLLTPAAPARAMPITRHALGTVTRNLTGTGPSPRPLYPFTVGESVDITWTYDPDVVPSEATPSSVLRFDLRTGTGFRFAWAAPPPPYTYVFFGGVSLTPGGGLEALYAGSLGYDFRLDFPGGGEAGTLSWRNDLGPGEGFLADVRHLPEPSTWALGLVGGGLLLAARRARR